MQTKLIRRDISFGQQLMCHFAAYLAMLSRWLLRNILHRGATAFPGQIAKRLVPNFLGYLAENRQLIFVTGTNGKTTTVRLLVKILENAGLKVVTNISGANLEDGIIAAFLEHYQELLKEPWQPEQSKLVFVMEIDEAFFSRLGKLMPWQMAVVTNLFRDQLDRYGELANTRKLISNGLNKQTDAIFVTCADDAMSMSLQSCHNGEFYCFGMDESNMQPGSPSIFGDGTFCFFCGSRLNYSAYSYAHLGFYECPNCHYRHVDTSLTFSKSADSKTENTYDFKYGEQTVSANLAIEGEHNAYNAACALLAAKVYLKRRQRKGLIVQTKGASLPALAQTLSTTKAAFGRMERIKIDNDRSICMILVKNPAGFTLAWNYVAAQADLGSLCLALNAHVNDGKDVSWIWDIDLESKGMQAADFSAKLGEDYQIFIGGERGNDMATRLYYANFPLDKLKVMPDFANLLEAALAKLPKGKCLYCLPNYTTMLAIRDYLVKKYNLTDFWR
ncbi:Mur ligase family protein [Amygdalobacter nucleatus]|uniref:Lipid II isoglutaminyl synthase (glutamine-hydrolyzing) subunit MurT n=1 Tax=Amygdalobacter nucleatus TaxID=3029274 RepID=A0A133Y9T8_9FIRM|nr:Mur ligase family protein [Amygdalobacter nucleatus]KXB39897.1 putative flagellar protein FliS [Amygdalobacter nucleatus]MDF0485345.1 MurT ligase domain-containing protein [Amygdalobacter nucleatus]